LFTKQVNYNEVVVIGLDCADPKIGSNKNIEDIKRCHL